MISHTKMFMDLDKNDYEGVDFSMYSLLYAKYYKSRSPKELLSLAGDLKGKKILDICAGDGRLTIEAMKQEILSSVMVDKSTDMMSVMYTDGFVKVRQIWIDINTALSAFNDDSIDDAFCQQGVNYWFYAYSSQELHRILKPGGCFVFNTFNTKPPEIPEPKSYKIGGNEYMEISWSSGLVVNHIQIAKGINPHMTQFMWIDPDNFRAFLDPYFEVKEKKEGRTSLYKCVNKP